MTSSSEESINSTSSSEISSSSLVGEVESPALGKDFSLSPASSNSSSPSKSKIKLLLQKSPLSPLFCPVNSVCKLLCLEGTISYPSDWSTISVSFSTGPTSSGVLWQLCDSTTECWERSTWPFNTLCWWVASLCPSRTFTEASLTAFCKALSTYDPTWDSSSFWIIGIVSWAMLLFWFSWSAASFTAEKINSFTVSSTWDSKTSCEYGCNSDSCNGSFPGWALARKEAS